MRAMRRLSIPVHQSCTPNTANAPTLTNNTVVPNRAASKPTKPMGNKNAPKVASRKVPTGGLNS